MSAVDRLCAKWRSRAAAKAATRTTFHVEHQLPDPVRSSVPLVASWLVAQGGSSIRAPIDVIARATGMRNLEVGAAMFWLEIHGIAIRLRGRPGRGNAGSVEVMDYDALLRCAATKPLLVPTGTSGEPQNQTASHHRGFNLEASDLETPEGLGRAFAAACKAGFMQASEACRVQFAAAVARAKRCAYDVVRFVAAFVRRSLWKHLTQRDEDDGIKLLRPEKTSKEVSWRVGALLEGLGLWRNHEVEVKSYAEQREEYLAREGKETRAGELARLEALAKELQAQVVRRAQA